MKILTVARGHHYAFEVGQKVRYKGFLGKTLKEGFIVKIIKDSVALVQNRKGSKTKVKLEKLLADASLSFGEDYIPLTMPWSKWLLQKQVITRVDPFLCQAIWTYVNAKVWPRKLLMPDIHVTDIAGFVKGQWYPSENSVGGGYIVVDRAGRFGLNGLASVVAHEACHQYQTFLGYDAFHDASFEKCAALVKTKTGIKVIKTSDEDSDGEFEMGLHKLDSDKQVYYLFLSDADGKMEAGAALSKTTAVDAFNAFVDANPGANVALFGMKDLALKKLMADLETQRSKKQPYTLTMAPEFLLDYANDNGKAILNHEPSR